jgi:hypothetical protein
MPGLQIASYTLRGVFRHASEILVVLFEDPPGVFELALESMAAVVCCGSVTRFRTPPFVMTSR